MSDVVVSLRKAVETAHSLAAESRQAANKLVDFADDSPTGYRITDGEVYHAHLRQAEYWTGVAAGLGEALAKLEEVKVA